jgi:DNA (cytosine-5)-methyltransferase 1
MVTGQLWAQGLRLPEGGSPSRAPLCSTARTIGVLPGSQLLGVHGRSVSQMPGLPFRASGHLLSWAVNGRGAREGRLAAPSRSARAPTVTGLFAGIGGIELGLHQSGFQSELLCEIDPAATAVLRARFPDVAQIEPDVRALKGLPRSEILAAGFPCQDLSQAGRTAGITGKQSGLIDYVFKLLEKQPRSGPRWLLIENVPFMLQLNRGRAMRYLTSRLEELGYTWAYRVVDARAFGLPQRRQRVFLLASKREDPRAVLYADDAGVPAATDPAGVACGFYWTEGTRGLGWAVDAVPTLKGGSTIGIPSPPGIWTVDRKTIVVPDIRDAERLQGFEADWTLPAVGEKTAKKGPRWKLVGNAVSVPAAAWIGSRLTSPGVYRGQDDLIVETGMPWPKAAWGKAGVVRQADVSTWPRRMQYQHLHEFLRFPTARLSERATSGFYERALASTLRFPEGFLAGVKAHLDQVRARSAVA